MNRKHSHPIVVSALVLLAAMIACASPGPSAPPVSTMDPLAVELAVAGTAQAAAQQTQQANPIPPTETPTPTATITPTPKVSLAGTSLVIQEDQSTLFIDHKLGFQVVVPTGWLTTRINEDEYFKAFTLDVVVANQPINERLRHMQTNNVDYFRLDSIDIRPGHIVNGIISSITVVHQPPEIAKTLEECLSVEKEAVKYSAAVGHKILSSKYDQTANGTRILIIEESWMAASNTQDKVFRKIVFFNVSAGIVNLDFQTHSDIKDAVLPDFEQVINSLTMQNPQ